MTGEHFPDSARCDGIIVDDSSLAAESDKLFASDFLYGILLNHHALRVPFAAESEGHKDSFQLPLKCDCRKANRIRTHMGKIRWDRSDGK